MSYRPQMPAAWQGDTEHLRKVTQAVNLINDALSVRGEINLTSGSVVVKNDKIGEDAIATLQPMDAGAASVVWYAVVSNKQTEFFYVSGTGGNFKYQILL